MNLLQTRKKYHLSQIEAAKALNVPIRTYIRYESSDEYGDSLKRESMIKTLIDKHEITEDKEVSRMLCKCLS